MQSGDMLSKDLTGKCRIYAQFHLSNSGQVRSVVFPLTIYERRLCYSLLGLYFKKVEYMTKDSEPNFGIIFIIFLQSKCVKKRLFSPSSHSVSKIFIYIFLILNGMSRFTVGLHKVSE